MSSTKLGDLDFSGIHANCEIVKVLPIEHKEATFLF